MGKKKKNKNHENNKDHNNTKTQNTPLTTPDQEQKTSPPNMNPKTQVMDFTANHETPSSSSKTDNDTEEPLSKDKLETTESNQEEESSSIKKSTVDQKTTENHQLSATTKPDNFETRFQQLETVFQGLKDKGTDENITHLAKIAENDLEHLKKQLENQKEYTTPNDSVKDIQIKTQQEQAQIINILQRIDIKSNLFVYLLGIFIALFMFRIVILSIDNGLLPS
eukprot:gb/GECH01008023.1/.p1 GENE.gb/GECH01008023.1/~~gb/GECH01008023.1/.p1  ORF type:complete len:223 (+),score=68.11 gb/GECH01008023.1/:1-669(+)